MTNLKAILNKLVKDDSGQDLIEYALIAALLALGAVTGMKTLSNSIGSAMTDIGSQLNSAA